MNSEPGKEKKKYYIYSSKAGKQGDLTPDRNSNTDNFLSFLQSKCLILEDGPSPSAQLDSSDKWAKWLQNLDTNGQFSVTVQGPPEKKIIESFAFEFNVPLLGSSPVVFSSSTDVLTSSFGRHSIPQPGIEPKGELLYTGLDLTATSNLKTTVRDVLDFVGDAVGVHFLPAPLKSLALTLDTATGTGKRNALWFSPKFYNQTTMRLHFQIDAFETFKEPFELHLGLFIDEASVICKKILIRTTTVEGPAAVDQGGIAFTFSCKLKVKDHDELALQTSADFRYNSVSFTFRPVAQGNILKTILLWLAQLAKIDLDDVDSVLGKDDLFESVHLREVTVTLGVDEHGKPTGINSFSTSIQVSTKMGTGEQKKTPLFLLRYRWEKAVGKMGELEGSFWSGSDLTALPTVSPSYEWWKELQPTQVMHPAESISLASIIPGTSIDNIPEFIPTQLTAASLSLSDTRFGIYAIIATEKPKDSNPPHPHLGMVQLRASYSWGKNDRGFSVELDIMSNLIPASTKPNPTMLAGRLAYDSSKKHWLLEASLEGLYASSLYEFFDQGSSDHVMPLIDSMQICDLTVRYEYEGGSGKGKSSGSKFDINGALLIADLELDLEFSYARDWMFKASLKPQNSNANIKEVIEGIIGHDQVDLPEFVANTQFSKGNTFEIEIKKEKPSKTGGAVTGGSNVSKGSFQFIARIEIGHIKLIFAQYHGGDWPAKTPSKRLFKVALQGLQIPEIKLIGKMEQPFDEMAFIWVQDPYTTKGLKGLTRKEVESFNASLADDPLIFKDKFKDKKEGDVLITAGSHFSINMKDASGKKSSLLMYDFKAGSKKKQPSQPGAWATTAGNEGNEGEGEEGTTAQAPLKKKTGPLSLKNIGLKYANGQLHIIFDATFDLGPLEFSLLGFSIGLEIFKFTEPPKVHPPTIEGLSIAFEKRPLTIAGIIRHGNTGELEYFAGGLIVGFVPWEFIAAGFYGDAKLADGTTFKSMFLFAKLNGPLFEIGFAEISGVTGGFGYNSEVRTPAPDQVVNFPFVATKQLGDKTGSPLETLEALTSQGEDGWFHVKDKTYWAAAGLKVSAFQMLSVDAVVIVQFGQAIKLGVFAVAIADIPSTKSPMKFAHVELGLAVVVDFDYGTMKIEGQLSPNSFILHPDCHLTGGFGLYYWFDGPHADKSVVGEFVFTLGGYHQSFAIPDGYPRPPRLGISWSLSKALSITGEAYFAITPKACMGGGRLHASFSAGPIEAWFDAMADFLINYRPFTFTATISISVGVKYSIDALFVHTSVSAELGASLTLWGPPVAGKVHVDFWVSSFDIEFGAGPLEPKAISLEEFYELVLQAGDKPQNLASLPAPSASSENILTRPTNEGHIFLALSGLVNDGEKTESKPNEKWTVRAGTFSFSVNCKMAVKTASQGVNSITHARDIYSKPMQLEGPMLSTLSITIVQGEDPEVSWRMEKQTKLVPTALWDKYSEATDPSSGNNHIPSLLDTKDSTVRLMMGVVFNVPEPTLSPDKLPIAETADKNIVELKSALDFPVVEPAAIEWEPSPSSGKEQWNDVRKAWKNPSLGKGDQGQTGFVSGFAKALGWDNSESKLSKLAGLPKQMDKRFNDLFVAAPLISKG
ncbi:hypothetical protein ASPWEDRAFT_100311 [Aspergillus wentii DTO 134E9]|uniref:DUF6603 domain-containing protein n=1 Tax=Aspergillus wentii DTO 134E9 TaxID=1073089 RepID=A0A1L9RYX7_ASPWE|nr:uncharacterized protein ASPWEDRAFT_100311 [Aspergillus wentii DTO 134E9]KAI9932538.1 hypothetical protein MW887_008780 [Aspergillus wentii]OJJ40103.1 hypothetical protein ASPWEDRAFT_100311 [Aspergillus wentii DTO 134E9]